MTMTSLQPNAPVQFSASAPIENTSRRKMLDYFSTFDNRFDSDIVYLSANESPPETDVSKAKKRLNRGLVSVAMLLASLGLAGGGVISSVVHSNQKPSEQITAQYETRQNQNAFMNNTWQGVQNSAAENAVFQNDIETELEFHQAVQSLLYRTVDTLEQYPSEGMNPQVISQLRANISDSGDFNAAAIGHDISVDFVNYLETELNLPVDPSVRQINQAFTQVESDFINQTPLLQNLSADKKAVLLSSLQETILSIAPNVPTSDDYDTAFTTALGLKLEGVNVGDFYSLQSEDQAIKLFETAVSNPNNFQNLSQSERDAFLTLGTDVLESLDLSDNKPEGTSTLLGLTAYSMILLGLTGSVGIGFIRRDEFAGLLQSRTELNEGLDKPTLLVRNFDKGDPENTRRSEVLNANIDTIASTMEKVLERASSESGVVEHFIETLYGNVTNRPDADVFRQMFTNQVVQDIQAQQTKSERLQQSEVNQLDFLEAIEESMQRALDSGNMLKFVLPESDEAPAQLSLDDATMVEDLYEVQESLDSQIQQAHKFLVNTLLSHVYKVQQIENLTKEISVLESRLAPQTDQSSESYQTDFSRYSQLTEQREAQEKLKSEFESHLNDARQTLGYMIAKLTKQMDRIQGTINKATAAESMTKLESLKEETSQNFENSAIQQLIDEVELQSYIQEAKQELDTAYPTPV